MRIKWMELEAAKIADPYIKTLFPTTEAKKLEVLRTMDSDSRAAHWCVTFRPGDCHKRTAQASGKERHFVFPSAQSGRVLVHAWRNRAQCPENAFVLAKHSFCMK